MMRPKISVVIPVYNRAHSVLPTLQSVQNQTFRDFECIVVDDGSRDGDELRQVVVENLGDARFRYLRIDNGGASAARNTGIAHAQGSFVALLDSDDRWLPDKLKCDDEAGACDNVIFSPMLIEQSGQIVGQRPYRGPKPGEQIADYLTSGQGFVPTSTIAVPTKLAAAVRYREGLSFGDDADFAIRLGQSGAAFKFLAAPRAVMCDDAVSDRLSQTADWKSLLEWTDSIRPLVSYRAYQALRGWHGARIAANSNEYATAVRLYVAALARGAFPPKLAIKALAQIFIGKSVRDAWLSKISILK